MAWLEIKRTKTGKLFQDSVSPAVKSFDAQSGTRWHYSDVYGTGTYDNEVDFTPERIIAGGYDGWRVQAAPWYYFLGRYPGSAEDGWIGFGGRRGQHTLWFQMLRAGFLRWSARDWWDIGGAPTYNRANLTRNTMMSSVTTTGAEIPVETVATWNNIWTTPGGGQIGARWRAEGNRLKEEIGINQVGRDWIQANRNPLDHWPGAELDDIYYGYIFRLDPSDIPRWVKAGILQDIEGDFDDDSGATGIEIQNALGEVLAFLPVDDAYVYNADGTPVLEANPAAPPEATNAFTPVRRRLRKRIYKDGSDYYLLVGLRADIANALPDGLLVFDPTVDEQVGAGADDAKETSWSFNRTDNDLLVIAAAFSYDRWDAGTRFQTVAIPQGTTCTVAYWQGYCINSNTDLNCHVYCEDVDDSADFATTEDVNGRTRTTANVDWDETMVNNTWEGSDVDVTGPVNEVFARAGWASGNDLTFLHIGDDNGGAQQTAQFRSYEGSTTEAAKLHIEYTEAAGGTFPNIRPFGMNKGQFKKVGTAL